MRVHFRSAMMAAALLGATAAASQSLLSTAAVAQAPAKAPGAAGTVKAVTPTDLVVTTAAGQEVAVTLGAGTKVLIVPPGSTSLSSATPGTVADVSAGDRAIVTGTAGDTMPSLNATRVILMKSNAIAARNAAAEQAWAQGVGGIVKSVSGSTIVISSGLKTTTVSTTPATMVRRYAPGSVRFEDAVKSDVASIHPGDQLRVRGSRSADGTTVNADEIVTGSFTNLSGVLTAIDPTVGSVTFKDLKTKKVVTVAVTDKSDVRRLPAMMAARMAGGGAGGRGNAGGPPAEGGEGQPGGRAPGGGASGGGAPGAGGGRGPGGRGGMGAGADLSRMLTRMPTETLSGLKVGDAVMIVATADPAAGRPVAVTLLTGVDSILAASPQGETELTPWSMGGGGGGGEEGGGGR